MSKHNRQKRKNINKTNNLLNSIKVWTVGVYVFLMLVVFILYAPEKYVYIGNHKIAFFERITGVFLVVSLILFMASLITRIIQKEKIKLNISLPEGALLLYGVWNLISYAFTPYKRGAIFGYDGWHVGLYMQLALIAVFLAVFNWKEKSDLLIKASAIVLIIECMMVCLQRFGFDPFGFFKGMGFMDWNRRNLLGTMGNTNWLMGYEIIIIPILIWLYINAKEKVERILWGIGNFFMVSALFLQDASSGIAAFAVILLFLIWVYIKDVEKLARIAEIVSMIFLFWSILSVFHVTLIEPEEKDTSVYYSHLWLIPVVIMGALIAGLYIYLKKKGKRLPSLFAKIVRISMVSGIVLGVGAFLAIQISDPLWQALGSIGGLRISDASGSFRVLLWKQVLKHFLYESNVKDFIFGVGPDCFGYWYETKNITIPVVGGPFMDAIFTNAHNDFLTSTVNCGIPGAVIYFLVFLSMAINAGITFSDTKEKGWAMPALLVLIGYVVNNVFSFQQVCSTPIFFVIMALMLTPKKRIR